MTTPSAKFVTAATVAASLDLTTKPERWRAGPPFDTLNLRPGRVILIGAPPGTGKTTLALQVVSDILTHNPKLRAVVGNVEMAPAALVEKLLVRFAAVDYTALQGRELLADERARIKQVVGNHAALLERLAFLDPPFTLRHLGCALLEFNARLALVDYAQRFITGEGDDRAKLDTLMSGVRALASGGAGIVLISSVSRQRTRSGSSTYADLGLASFRGSSEIEFGADGAYILDTIAESGVALLKCEKNRFRPPCDIHLRFDGSRQTFSAGDPLDQFDAAKGGEKDR